MANTDRLPNYQDGLDLVSKLQNIQIAVDIKKNGDTYHAWATATDEMLVEMLTAAYAGDIDLESDYGWAVGDERKVHLSAMAATGVGESHVAQDVTFVLVNKGGYTLTSGGTCKYVVETKNSLAEGGYMNSTQTNIGSWSACARRAWCNSIFYNALPTTFKSIFKQFNCLTAQTYNGSTNETTQDYFALPAAAEVWKGNSSWGQGGTAGTATGTSNLAEFNALSRWTYYETLANANKTLGQNGQDGYWWHRSPYYGNSNYFCTTLQDRPLAYGNANKNYGLAPFGCI